MPHIGSGPQNLNDILPAWATLPGAGSVSQWPQPNGGRTDGRFWINSDPLQRALARRWIFRVQLTHYPNFPSLSNPITQYEWFWLDLQAVGGADFDFDSGVSPSGVRVSGEGAYLDDLGLALGSGFYWLLITDTGIDGDAERELRLQDSGQRMSFNTELPFVTGFPNSDPPQDDAVYGPYYQAVDVNAWPVSDCFPTDQFEIQTGEAETVIGALFLRDVDGLSYSPAVAIPWNTTAWNNVGTILDPGDSSKLIIPSGYSFARFNCNLARTSSNVSFTSYMQKNGGWFQGAPLVTLAPGFSAFQRLSWTTGWLEVVAGDVFDVWGQSNSGTLVGANGYSWVSIELGNP